MTHFFQRLALLSILASAALLPAAIPLPLAANCAKPAWLSNQN
ncbi:MAG TPA: hypothetical protein PLT23_10115 [Lentisphaeria bacterium]|nr:hypothetical protein [Lentisphaeria bacterium]HQL88143.1 hypothetical protein [Lentisphaeria bacterium]